MRVFWRALACACALAILCAPAVLGHDMQGHFAPKPYSEDQYLHGKKIGGHDAGKLMNCCTYDGGRGPGDCREVSHLDVERVEGGFRLRDGEFIPQEAATLSPDGKMYRCRFGSMPSHCFFYTETLI